MNTGAQALAPAPSMPSMLRILPPEQCRRTLTGGVIPLNHSYTQVEEVLNSIFPPQVWEDENRIWQQRVDPSHASRLDVVRTQEILDQLILSRKAREDGWCPVREQIYDQAFDELIRQETVDCPERGLLLVRIRDELRMRLNSFKTLAEGSLGYGLRKSNICAQVRRERDEKVKKLQAENQQLAKQVSEINARLIAGEKREILFRAAEEAKRKEEIAFLKNSLRQMKTQLELFFASQKQR